MGNYENLKQSITEVIRTNGNQEITGAVLQRTLLTIISTVGANATFAGIATPTTNPGTPDGPVFYLASESGTYTNFSAIELQDGLSVLMWNGSWSSQQIFSIDDEPTAGSDNLVKSSGVFNNIGAIDVSELNATENPHTLATYEDLTSALNALPTSYRKGGMMIKFVQGSDNKYVQYRLMNNQWSTTESDWQGVDEEPTAGSDNLVKSGGVFESFNVVEKEINGDYLVLLSSLTVYQDRAYINGSGQITSNDSSKILSMPLGGIQTISYVLKELQVFATLLVEKNGTYVEVSKPTVANQTTLFDVSQYDSTYTLYVNWWGANTNDPSQYLDRITLLSKGLTEMVEDLEAASLKHEDELEQIFYNTAVSYGCGEDVYSSLGYITNDALFFQSVSGQTYPQKVTRATFKKADAGTINFYKAKVENNVASNVVLIKSVDGAVSETELDVELGENEFIGIGGSFTYKNGGGTEYSSRTCSTNGGNLSVTARQVIGYTLYGTVLNSKVEDLESSVSELQDRKANVLIVDQSGKGDFISLEDALHVVTDRTTPWGLTIIVKPGTYTMSTWVGNDSRYFGAYRMLSIIGTNKNACKVICSKGVYTTSPYVDSAPIKLAGNCQISNLTIISSDSESEYTTADNKSYCVHLDNEVSSASPKRLTLKDCILQNDHYACVGIGLHNNYTVEIINCEMSSIFKTGGDSVGAVLCHEGSDTGTCKLIMRNNVIKSSGDYGLSLHSPYNGSINIELCNNIIDADGAGFLYDATKHIKDNLCFGNNIQAMNK